MKSIEQGKSVLRTTEKQLRELVGEAANEGEYDAVLTLTKWASQLAGLVNGYAPKTPGRGGASRAWRQKNPRQSTAMRKARTRKAAATNGYPKFVRSGNDLVKIGWSKKSKEEYQHRAPYSALQALAAAMGNVGRDGRVFSTDELLPLHDAEESQFPSYQVYVCIALLKQTGLIDQHGRQGYSTPQSAEFKDAIQSVWRKLPDNRALSEATQ